MTYEHDPLTERIIRCAYTVIGVMGCGYVEKVYENALLHELRKDGLKAEQQVGLLVHYDCVAVGEYFVDILVEGRVVLELKVAKAIDAAHVAQGLNYLKATGHHLCLILNFGTPQLGIKRVSL